jgi:hypothetical protein
MAMFDQTDATNVLAAILNAVAYPTVTTTYLRLGTSTPSAAVNMTELSSSGYTPGGQVIAWNGVLAATTSNSSALSWTNSSGGSWSLVGLEVWDTTPARHLWGTWTGQPVNVGANNTFQVAAAGITVSLV